MGLRFLASLIIIIHHIEQSKKMFGLDNLFENPMIGGFGGTGVTLFFVLSGFLVTYFLLKEKAKYGEIDIRSFYKRRILRIWPLYFLIVIFGFFIIPQIDYFNLPNYNSMMKDNFILKLLLFLFIMPNFALSLFPPVPYIAVAWVIGVEEQFYLFWPNLIKRVEKHIGIFIIIIFCMILLSHGILVDLLIQGNKIIHIFHNDFLVNLVGFLNNFFMFFRIDSLIVGAIGAFILINNKMEFLDLFFSRTMQVFVLCITLIMITKGLLFSHLMYSIMFIIIILNMAANKENIFKLENRVFNYLGKISYGIYLFHPFMVIIVLKTMMYFDLEIESLHGYILLYFLSVILTVGIATLSFYLYEKRFLDYKMHYKRI